MLEKPNIYVIHSRRFDFKNELYLPIKKSPLIEKYNFKFPHETEEYFVSEGYIKEIADLVFVEASFPSNGGAIEVNNCIKFNTPFIFGYREGSNQSSKINDNAHDSFTYKDSKDFIKHMASSFKRFFDDLKK